MSRIKPLAPDAVPELESAFRTFESRMGFRANSGLIMARRPAIVTALAELAVAIYDREAGEVPFDLKCCICQIASLATGCLYCQAHFANNVLNAGVAAEKLENLWTFDSSELFSEAERAALRFALAASQVPNGVTDELFDELRAHWDDGQIVEILATVCYTGFLNRWNDSLATQLEDRPARVAKQHLAGSNWTPGKHAGGG